MKFLVVTPISSTSLSLSAFFLGELNRGFCSVLASKNRFGGRNPIRESLDSGIDDTMRAIIRGIVRITAIGHAPDFTVCRESRAAGIAMASAFAFGLIE